MTDTIAYLVTVYLCFAFIKFMLCLPHVPRVIAILSRLSGAQRGVVKARYVFTIPLVLVCMVLIGWVVALYREGLSFFVMYKNRDVTRDCINGFRETHKE